MNLQLVCAVFAHMCLKLEPYKHVAPPSDGFVNPFNPLDVVSSIFSQHFLYCQKIAFDVGKFCRCTCMVCEKNGHTVLASFSAHTTVLMLSFLDQKLGCLSMTSLPSQFNMLVASPFLVCVVQIRLNLYTGGSARRHDPRCSRCQRNHPCRSRHLRRMITPNFPAASTCIICSTLSAICCQILVRIYNNVFKCLLYKNNSIIIDNNRYSIVNNLNNVKDIGHVRLHRCCDVFGTTPGRSGFVSCQVTRRRSP